MRKYFKTFFIYIICFTPFCNLFSQWTIAGNFKGGYVNSIFVNDPEIYAGTSTQGVFKSDNDGSNWIQINSGLGNSLFVQSLSAKDNYIFAGTSSGGIFYSSNKGANWIQSNQGLGQLNIKALITDSGNVYAGCIFAGIFRSTNNGLNWARFGLGEGDLLYTLSYNETNFFVGLNGAIYRSTNNGANWILAYNGLTNLEVRSIVQYKNKTYCGTFGGGVFVSENNGVLWNPLSSGLPDQRILTLATDGNSLFAGTFGKGIHYFNNSSGSWMPVNEELTDTLIASIAINDEYIFAGSSRGRVWRRPISEIITGINQNSIHASKDFQLHQNYPNPFNPATGISFYLPKRVYLSLKIFDNLGREIADIFSGVLSEGKYTKYWNAGDHPAGIYFYRLQSGLFSETKKLVLVK